MSKFEISIMNFLIHLISMAMLQNQHLCYNITLQHDAYGATHVTT